MNTINRFPSDISCSNGNFKIRWFSFLIIPYLLQLTVISTVKIHWCYFGEGLQCILLTTPVWGTDACTHRDSMLHRVGCVIGKMSLLLVCVGSVCGYHVIEHIALRYIGWGSLSIRYTFLQFLLCWQIWVALHSLNCVGNFYFLWSQSNFLRWLWQ